jgi:lipoyl synthase
VNSFLEIEIRRHTPTNAWTYEQLDCRQREIARQIPSGEPGRILLSEVAPVVTVGRRSPETDLLLSRDSLRAQGVAVINTDRGGMATYHGPGQWVLFIVESLERLTGDRRGVRKAVDGLLEIAQKVGTRFKEKCEIRAGCELGAWTPRGKFAALGIHVEDGVLLHGLAVNGFRTEKSFLGIRPCGLDAPVDYLLENDRDFERLGTALGETARHRFARSC